MTNANTAYKIIVPLVLQEDKGSGFYTRYFCPPQNLYRCCPLVIRGIMKKVYKLILVTALVVAVSTAAVYTVVFFGKEFQSLEEKQYNLQQQFMHRPVAPHLRTPLTEEEEAEVETIVESDDVVNAVLQVLGEADIEVFRGPADTVLYKCTSEEWVIQVTVSLETQKVIAVSMNKGMIPLVINPQNLVQIAEKEFPPKEFGTPVLKKVVQTNGDGEVVFLTDEGTVTVKIDLDEGKVIEFEKISTRPSFWRSGLFFIFVIMAAVVVAVVLALIKRKRESQKTEKPESESEPR